MIVATEVVEDTHVAELVTSRVDPSVYVPVAVNCCVVPLGIDRFAGVTAIETRTAGPTVKVVVAVTPAELALIWEVPCAAPVARPLALMVATAVFEDAQVAEFVRFWVDPSE